MPSAVVLGGGIAGLAAGQALTQAGWRVRVFERATRLEAIGVALSLWPNAVAGLDRLGLGDAVRRRSAPFTTMLVADRLGRPIIPARPVGGEALMITRADLQTALLEAMPPGALTLGREVVGVVADRDDMLVHLVGGGNERADIVVDAGGLRSAVAGDQAVTYRGYGGTLALSDPVDDGGLAGLAAEYWGWHERFGLFELPARRRYWFYMRDQAADATMPTLGEVMTRAAGFPAAIERAVAATAAERLIPISIHARPAPRSLGEGRLIRVGDAAHAMEPNLGQGACQAIEDAVALHAVARSTPPDEMLSAFEQLRLRRVARIVRRAAEGKFGAHGPLATQWMTRTMVRLMPAAVTAGVVRSIQTIPPYGA